MEAPFSLLSWIEANKETLKPPVGNRQLFQAQWENFVIMVVGGPNDRTDYHDDPGEEIFYQIKGDVTLRLITPSGERSEVVVREGEIFLLPAHTRHSPQRPAGCIGLVIERYRQPGEVDALEWYSDDGKLDFRGEFFVKNIEQDLNKVIAAWKDWSQRPDRKSPAYWRVGQALP